VEFLRKLHFFVFKEKDNLKRKRVKSMREGIEFKMTRPDLRLFETKIFAGT